MTDATVSTELSRQTNSQGVSLRWRRGSVLRELGGVAFVLGVGYVLMFGLGLDGCTVRDGDVPQEHYVSGHRP